MFISFDGRTAGLDFVIGPSRRHGDVEFAQGLGLVIGGGGAVAVGTGHGVGEFLGEHVAEAHHDQFAVPLTAFDKP